MRSFTNCQKLLEWLTQGDELGRTYSKHGRDEKCIRNFGQKTKERGHFGNPTINDRTVL
jgi:hypothetical protein